MLIHNLMAFKQISTILNLQKDNKIHRITKEYSSMSVFNQKFTRQNFYLQVSKKKKKSQLSVAKENRELEG